MVAYFTGLGAGFERGSGSVLGSMGLWGSSSLGRSGEQLFLNAANGNLMVNQTDEYLVGLGLDAMVSRTYNSQGDWSDDNGDNWRQGYDHRVQGLTGTLNTAGSTIQRVSGDGSVITYTWDANYVWDKDAAGVNKVGAYVATDGGGSYDTLTNASGTWTWTDGDSRVTEIYELSSSTTYYRLKTAKDADLNALSITYKTGTDLVETVTTKDGSTLTYSWSGTKLMSVTTGYQDLSTVPPTDRTLTRTSYAYDGQNRLSTVTVDLTPDVTNDNVTYVTTYSYDGNSTRIASISQSDGSQISFSYLNDNGTYRVQTITQAVAGSVTRVTTLAYATDAGTGDVTTTITDSSQSLQVTLISDNKGQLKEIRLPQDGSTSQQSTRFTYDTADGDVLTVARGLLSSGLFTPDISPTYTFDTHGNWLTRTDALGNVTTRTYGVKNELLTETTTGVDHATDNDSGTASPASRTHTTRYVYDGENHLRFIVTAEGHVTEYQYATSGLNTFVIRYTEHQYDVSGLASDQFIDHTAITAWADGLADKSSIELRQVVYDARGNVTQDRLFSTATTTGGSSGAEGTLYTYYTYDQAGRLIERHVGTRNSESFIYDGLGRLTSSIDVHGGKTSFVFDDANSRTIVTFSDGRVTTSTYNLAGELISAAETGRGALNFWNDGSDATTGWTTVNSALTSTGGRLRVTTSTGGNLGRAYQTFSTVVGKTYTLTLTGYAGTTGTKVTLGTPGGVSSIGVLPVISSGSDTQTFSFVATSTTTYLNLYANSTTSGDYAEFDEVKFAEAPAATSGYDSLGRMRWHIDATGNASYFVYDKTGRKIADVAGNGEMVEYVYDSLDRLVATVAYNTKVSAANLASLANENSVINIATLRPAADNVDATGNPGVDRWSWRVYDKESRLLQTIEGDGSTAVMTYDDEGKLTYTRAYYNKLDMSAYRSAAQAVIAAKILPTADASLDAISRNYYDKDGRLIGAIDAEGYVTEIVYDLAGRKTDVIAYANKTTASISIASFDDIRSGITTSSTADRHTRYVYNGQGQLRYVIDALLHVVDTQFDNSGGNTVTIAYATALNPATTDFTYDAIKAQVTAAGFATAGDRQTNRAFDSAGRLAYVVDAEGAVTGYSYRQADSANPYNGAGLATKVTRYATKRTSTAWASLATMDSWAAGASVANHADNRITRNFYNGAGVLRYVVDGEGYVTRLTEDAEGRPTKTERFAGQVTVTDSTTYQALEAALPGGTIAATSSSYDVLGRLETSTDGEGFITKRFYKANGLLEKVTAAFGTADASTTLYDYDAAGRVSVERRAYGTAIQANTAYTYDGQGNVLTITDALGKVTTQTFDQMGRPLTRQDPLGGLLRFAYNSFGEVTRTINEANQYSYNYYDNMGRLTTSVDPLKYVTEYSYNDFGELWATVRHANAATNAVSITTLPVFTADAAKDQLTSYVYDRRGLVIEVRDAKDYLTRTVYNAFGEVDTVTRHANTATGARNAYTLSTITLDAAKDAVTDFDYTRLGQVKKVTDAGGFSETYHYNALGNRDSVTNKIGGTVTSSYDRRGLLVSETLQMPSYRSDGTVQATMVTNTFSYDGRGNRTQMVEAAGLLEQRTTLYTYDALDRLASKKLDAVTALSYNDFTSTTAVTVTSTGGVVPTESYQYDALGRLKEVTDALGGRTVSFYDDLGRKTGEVGPLGTMTEWTYDAVGNMLSATVYGDPVAVPSAFGAKPNPIDGANKRQTDYSYDLLNRLNTTSVANVVSGSWNGSTGVVPSAPQTITTTNGYDAFGNVVSVTDANGNTSLAFYDQLNRKTTQVDALNFATSWTYDSEGNVKKETRYALALASTPSSEPTSIPTSADDRVTDFTYDRNGRRLTEARANVKIATVNATNGAITESTVTSTVSYTYNGLGQVLTKAEGTGDTVTYSYDATGRLTKEARASYADQGGATVTPTVDYLYNGLNDLARTRQGGATANAGDRITTYAYGANGRLSQVVDPAGATHNYDYDAAGNIMRDWYVRTKSDGTTQVTEGILYRRDLLGRVIGQAIATKNSDTSWTRGDGQNSEYNAYGDMARRGINGLWQETFAYNNRGLVEKSNSGDGVWRFFVYDKNGNQTLAIEDENYTPQDLSTKTLSQVLGYLGATAGATFVDGLNVTIATYDKRGQALSSILTQRELSATGAKTALTTSQAYNAFGEVKSQTDARGYTSDFTYNTMGRLTKKELPSVSWTSETGVVASARPTEQYYYDKAGRLVASRDANGNLLSRTLLAGSGYGEAEALVTSEFHADGGIAKIFYDQFGDARILRNELGYDETRTYDAMGRLLTQVHRGGLLTDTYVYDILGQRTRHWNSLLGSGNVERTDYDLQGRVVSQVAFGGDTTTTSYTWLSTLATGGMATYGGWQQVDTYANSKTMTVKSDIFGRDTSKTDLGGHVFTYTYDKAGRQVTRATTGETLTTTWLNTGLVDKLSFGASDYATYSYDANGNHLTEYTVRAGTVAQNATASYDALNRMVSWAEAGGTTVPAASKSIEYDLNGNIRRSNQMVWSLDEWGATNPNSVPLDSWYAYDAMNRVVITDAKLSNGQYVPFVDTSYISYDLAGRRVQVEHRATKLAQVANPNYQPPSGGEPGVGSRYKYISYTYKEREDYSYNANDTMATVRIGATTYSDNGNGTATFYGPPAVGALKGSYTYDTMGRVTHQIDWIGDGTNAGYDRTVTYNTKGQISAETDITKRKVTSTTYDTYTDNMTYSYGTGTGYALGQVVQVTDDTLKNGSDSAVPDTLTTNAYAWYSSAVQSSITFDGDTGSSSNPIYTTTFTNSPSGILTSAYVGDNRPRTVTYVNDMDGMTIRRQEADNISTEGDPLSIWYRFNGREVASTNNRGNVNTTTYQGSITARTGAVQPTNPYTFTAVSIPDGDLSYEAVNSYKQGSAGGRYTARAGDTLEGIAQSVWGDSSLWYKIAEANGLSGGANLSEGQSINLPSGVTRSKNNANTYKPYDTAEAVGDVSPTTPKPPKKNKCGFIGQVLIAAVAIAVSVALGPEIVAALQPLFGTAGGLIVGGAVTGAVSSVASQGVGIATGIQDGFSWKGVAIAALAGAIGGGLGKGGVFGANGAFGNVQSSFVRGALQGAAGAALSNGIGVITGLQPKFSWAGVAAAAASGGIGGKLEADARYTGLSRAAQGAIGGSARLIASAATRSVIEGSDFGDNLLAGLPDVIAQTIGGMIEDGVGGGPDDQSFLAGGDQDPPTRAELAKIYGPEKANAIFGMFTEGTATKLDANGNLILTPELSSYLAAHAPTADDLRGEEAHLLQMARDGSLKAYYDFGYADGDPANRFDTSMASIGDDRRAAALALQRHKLAASDENIALLSDRVFSGNKDAVVSKEMRGQFNKAARDLGSFVEYRSDFLGGLARSSLAINALAGFSATIPANTRFAQAVGDMRSAIDQGYFTLRPYMSISSSGMNVFMQQYNAGGQSETIIYREGFGLSSRMFSRGIFHELTHAQSMQESLYSLEMGANRRMRSTQYSPDPRTYYNGVHANLVTRVVVPGGGGKAAPGSAPIMSNYEKGHLFEGNVNNWYASSILGALRLR